MSVIQEHDVEEWHQYFTLIGIRIVSPHLSNERVSGSTHKFEHVGLYS